MLFKCMHNYLQSDVFQVTSYSLRYYEEKITDTSMANCDMKNICSFQPTCFILMHQ